jgi:hypothetical protein
MSLGIAFQLGVPQTVIPQTIQQGRIESPLLFPPYGATRCTAILLANVADYYTVGGHGGQLGFADIGNITWFGGNHMVGLQRPDPAPPGVACLLPAAPPYIVAFLSSFYPMNVGLQVTFN